MNQYKSKNIEKQKENYLQKKIKHKLIHTNKRKRQKFTNTKKTKNNSQKKTKKFMVFFFIFQTSSKVKKFTKWTKKITQTHTKY